MKLIHLTARRFENLTADSIYVSNLVAQFSRILSDSYLLVVGNKSAEQFAGVNVINLNFSSWGKGLLYFWPPYFYYFFWLPYFMLTRKFNNSEAVFFSSDSNLLTVLIWWKKLFGFKFKICSDWHMLHNNFKDNFIPRNSDYLITTSEKLKRGIIDRSRIKPDKIKVVYGGVDILGYQALFESRRELNLPEDKKLVGYVGLFKTMGMEKGLRTMIEALKYLDQETVMVFVGAKSGQIEEYKNIAKGFKVESRCIFIDMQPVERIPAYERAMDILVIPYPDKPHFRDFGFPMKVYEYMASQSPIVYSRLDLAEEVIGDCAVGFEADNAKDLAEKISWLEKNKAQGSALAEKAYSKVRDYSWKNKSEQIVSFIGITF